MFEALFGTEMPLALRFFIAFLFVLGLIGGAAYLVRRFGSGSLGSAAARGRQPRLAVIDAAPVDGRRRMVLIRRDNVEHLIMIGGPTDVVVESNIVRAAPAAAARETPPARAETPPRAVSLTEGNMWPLQPEPVTRPARQAAPPVDEPMWPAQPAEPPPRASGGERLAGLAADLSRVVPSSAPEHGPAPARTAPVERPMVERPIERESRRPAPVVAAPVAAVAPPSASDEQNLAEMAHRLEAALRRPSAGEAAPSVEPIAAPPVEAPMVKPVREPMTRPSAPAEAPAMPPVAAAPRAAPAPMPDIARMTVDAKVPPKAARPDARSQTKAVYDSLEQEMASLLGRPSGKT